MAVMDTKKSRQKRRKRAHRAMGRQGPSQKNDETPLSEPLWYPDIWRLTEFDAVLARQAEPPTQSLDLPNLDSWGWPFFLMLISTFFTSAYARTLEKPYRLPKAPLEQSYGARPRNTDDGAAHSTDDLYDSFAMARGDEGSRLPGGEAARSKNAIAPPQGRAKRSGGIDPYRRYSHHSLNRHHDHHPDHHRHRRRHHRRHVAETAGALQNAVVYPEAKLSPWMRNLINSVESIVSLFGPALRAIGFESDERIDVQRMVSGTQHLPIAPEKVTAAEFASHLTAKGSEGFALKPLTERGRELESAITDQEKYGEQNFLAKAVLDPIKAKIKHEGLRAIEDKFEHKYGIFLNHAATLYHVTGRRKPSLNLRSGQGSAIKGELGTIVKLAGTTTRYFAIVPHHPEMVIPVPDPDSGHEWRAWMASTGRQLFFSDPGMFPSGSTFSTVAEDPANIAHPSHTLRGAVFHTINPIIAGTMRHMTELVTHETPAEKVLNRILGFIPFYDVAKSFKEGEYKKAIVFLGFELIPYVGKGAKILFKATFKAFPARAAADRVASLADRGFSAIKEAVGSDIADAAVKERKPSA